MEGTLDAVIGAALRNELGSGCAMKALFAAALILLAPGAAGAAAIDVLQARFGTLMAAAAAAPCDATDAVKAACEGRASCTILPGPSLCAAPAETAVSAGQLSVNYQCVGQNGADFEIAPEGSPLTLACTDAAAAPAAARTRRTGGAKARAASVKKAAPARRVVTVRRALAVPPVAVPQPVRPAKPAPAPKPHAPPGEPVSG